MVHGLEKFKEYFEEFADNYVLIGGTACDILMDDLGLDFRATNDLDIVLITESMTKDFRDRLQLFLNHGGYKNLNKSSGQEQFFRFSKPTNELFPKMIELFCRTSEEGPINLGDQFVRLEVDGNVISLSAILLNNAYYDVLLEGRTTIDGLSLLNTEVVILFKIKAWLDLSEKRSKGEEVQMNDIKKHKNDVLRLLTVISPSVKIGVDEEIQRDIKRFVEEMNAEPPDLKSLKINARYEEMQQLLISLFQLSQGI
jgi:hypothetical protein